MKFFLNVPVDFRKSVIVRREQAVVVAEPEIQIQVQLKDGNLAEGPNPSEIIFSLNIEELENIFTVEEGNYFDNLRADFDQKWNTIPLGEDIMSHLINLCKKKHRLPARFFQFINNRMK